MLKIILNHLLLLLTLTNIIIAASGIPKGQWKQFLYTDGLSSNYIFDVEKDELQRIWVGTQNGVTLIDGTNTIKFGSAHGLPAADIVKIVSFNGKIYAATSNQGIYSFNGDNFEKEKFIKGVDIYAMDKVGNELFVSTNLENVMFDGSNRSFMGKGFPNTKIRDVYIHVDGRAWYVAEDQIIKESGKGFISEKIRLKNNRSKIQTFSVDGDDQYFGTSQGLWVKKNGNEPRLVKNMNVLCLSRSTKGDMLVGSKKGLYYLKNGKLNGYGPHGDDHKALSSTPIQDIEVLSQNEIWFSTFGMGLYLQDPGTFETLDSKNGIDVGGMTFDMVMDKEKIFIATRNGLFVYQNEKVKAHYTKKDGLPSNTILDLDLDSKGVLWLATSNGLSRFSGSMFKNYSRNDGLPSKLVTSVHVDKNDDSKIWTGSDGAGLTRFDEKGFFTFAMQDGLPSNSIPDIIQLDDGTLVIACYGAGLAKFDGNTFKLFNEGLDDNRVRKLAVGIDGQIWAGTESAGIGVLKGDDFEMLRDSDGLAHNEILSLFYDGKRMWAGTFGGGVSCFFDETWFTMRESDGLNSNTIGSIVNIDDNKLVLGGNNGISILSLIDEVFKLSIDNVLTPNAELLPSDLTKDPISGIVKDRFFITVNPMLYNPTGANTKYRARIIEEDGREEVEWSALQLSPQISYMPQGVGSYDLEVQAVDNRVSFSDVITIPFEISRVWYLDPKTAVPFWGSILLLIGFSSVTYVNYRKKSKEAQELRDAEIERQQAEMEEAREFQQAMLPKEMPSTHDYEMVGFQQTATEVGGDFFDFMQKENGRWIAICGDATGHGLTSGNVVSITKTAMSALVEEDPVPTLDSLNTTLLKMNIGLNRMCLNIANVGKDSIRFSSAGMPPAYFYSAEKGELEEVLVGALPLGSFPSAIHMEQEIPFKNKGDILVMMSDGLPEAENMADEMVGYDRTEEKIKSLVDRSAEEIKDGLVDLCNSWLDGHAELKDDMTFVIIKKK